MGHAWGEILEHFLDFFNIPYVFFYSVATDSRHNKLYRPLLESDGSLNFGEEIFFVAEFEETIEFGKH